MEKNANIQESHCLNCGAAVKGEFCHECGQQVRDNTDRSLGRLLGEFLTNTFFLDNRFFLSAWYLVRYPSRMTVEFLAGRRKKFISPITLFLFLNLIYFFVKPLTDYSLSLEDQLNYQPYSGFVKDWVVHKLQEEELEPKAYSITYQNMSDNVSNSIMIINVPLIALFVFLMAFKKRPYYFDSLIFAFHFFSLFMGSWIMLDWVDQLLYFLIGHYGTVASEISFNLFVLLLPLFYAILGMKKFMSIRWYWSIPAGMGVMLSVLSSNMLYRFIILVLTIWMT